MEKAKLVISGEEFDVEIMNWEIAESTIPRVEIAIYSNIEKFEEFAIRDIQHSLYKN